MTLLTNKSLIEYYRMNSLEVINPYTIADKFNDYFVNVGTEIANKMPNCKRKFNKYRMNNYKESFFLNRRQIIKLNLKIEK